MSEDIKPEEVKPQLPIITIQMTEDGGVIVAGPIRDKILSYGMLEAAKDAIHEHHMEQKYSIQKKTDMLITKSNGHMMDFVRRFKH